VKVNLCDGAIGIERGIEHVKQCGVPASTGGAALERITTIAHNPPDLSGVANPFKGVERVE